MKFRPLLSIDWSGKIGNNVAARARGGIQYLRALVLPRNPRTFLQTVLRAALSSAAVIWRTVLSEAQQEAWWDRAEGGQTGQSLFTKVNQPRIYSQNSGRFSDILGTDPDDLSDPVLLAPPDSMFAFLSAPTIVIDDSANTLVLSNINVLDPFIADALDDAPGLLYVYVSHQQSSSRFSRQHPYQLVECGHIGAGAVAGPVTVNLATFGFTTEVGKVMYVKLIAQHPDGGISVAQETRVTIVA